MKINNLEVGKTYKNYKELCSALGVKPKAGNSKKNQMKHIESWVELSKKGHSLKVEKIFDKQQFIEDGRGLNPNSHSNQKGAYGKYIRLLILNMLSQGEAKSKGNVVIIGRNEMLQKLSMINENYRYGSYNRKQMAHYLGMDISFIDEFYKTNTRKMRDAVETTLNSLMRNEKLIFWSLIKIVGSPNGTKKQATDEEVEIIVNCEKEALEDMKVEKMDAIYASNRLDEFYSKVNAKLRKHNILFNYNAYKIIFAEHVYEKNEQLIYTLELEEEKTNQVELNTTVKNNLVESMEYRHKKITDESKRFFGAINSSWLNQNNGYKKILLDKNYLHNGEKLADICIDLDYENICEAIGRKWFDYLEMSRNNPFN